MPVARIAGKEALDWPKGSTWLLQRTEHHVRARYLPPLALAPTTAFIPMG